MSPKHFIIGAVVFLGIVGVFVNIRNTSTPEDYHSSINLEFAGRLSFLKSKHSKKPGPVVTLNISDTNQTNTTAQELSQISESNSSKTELSETDELAIELIPQSRDSDLPIFNSDVPILEPVNSSNCSSNNTVGLVCDDDRYVCKKRNCAADFESPPVQNCSSESEFLLINRQRKQRIASVCKQRAEAVKGAQRKETFYFEKLRYGWCPVFKSCSSAINSFFCPMYYDLDYCKTQIVGAGIWRNKKFLEVPKVDTKLEKFIAVRDPFSRVLSAYRDKLENFRPNRLSGPGNGGLVDLIFDTLVAPRRFISHRVSKKKGELLKKAKVKANAIYDNKKEENTTQDPSNPYEHPMYATFPEYIGGVLSGVRNEHWISASEYCAPCNNGFDYIIKAKDFGCEFPNFLKATGNEELLKNQSEEFWATNKNPQKSKTMLYEYWSQVSDNHLEEFMRLFSDDCELFDFNCEETLCKIRRWKALHST